MKRLQKIIAGLFACVALSVVGYVGKELTTTEGVVLSKYRKGVLLQEYTGTEALSLFNPTFEEPGRYLEDTGREDIFGRKITGKYKYGRLDLTIMPRTGQCKLVSISGTPKSLMTLDEKIREGDVVSLWPVKDEESSLVKTWQVNKKLNREWLCYNK